MSGSPEVRSEALDALVGQVADDFLARQERGEHPDIESYATAHPEAADMIRNVLLSLRLIEMPLGDAASGDEPQSRTLGDFRIVREVGRGGMGVVYEAEQISLGRRVALKVLPFAATMDPRQLLRFHNEARAAASLHHEHIVPVHGVGCERGVHFYAMQFIDGVSLAELIARQRKPEFPPATGDPTTAYAPTLPVAAATTLPERRDAGRYRRVAGWGVQAAVALEHAHNIGIVHRDVKPGNLMIDAQGKLWVTDFGLAKTGGDNGMTMTGDLLGTLRYMSPEQAMAKHGLVDHRTDVYSLGATLYELLTLRPAVDGKDRHEVLKNIAFEEPVNPRRIEPGIPLDLETVVLKALAKDPNERYATAKELADDLRRFLEDRPVHARRTSLAQRLARLVRRHQAAVTWGVLFLAFFSALGSGTWLYVRHLWDHADALSTAAGKSAAAVERDRLDRAENYAATMASLAQRWKEGQHAGLREGLDRLRPREGEQDQRGFEWYHLWYLSAGLRAFHAGKPYQPEAVCFSPDGSMLALAGRDGIQIRDARSGKPLKQMVGIGATLPVWLRFSADGHRLISAAKWVWNTHSAPGGGVVKVWDVTTATVVAERAGPACQFSAMAASPDGRTVAFGGPKQGSTDLHQVELWNPGTGQVRVVWQRKLADGDVTALCFAPGGTSLALAYKEGEPARIDLLDLRTGQVRATLRGHNVGVHGLAFSPEGAILASGSCDTTVKLWDAATGELRRALAVGEDWGPESGFYNVNTLAFSHDGRTLAAGWQNYGAGVSPLRCRVSLWDVDSGARLPRELYPGGPVGSLAFAPDRQVLAVASGDKYFRLWDLPADRKASRLLTNDPREPRDKLPREAWSVAFSPDGETLAVGYDDEKGGDRRTLQLWETRSGRLRANLTGHASMVYDVAFSPDGRTLVSAGHDRTVRLWDPRTGLQRGALVGHTDKVRCVAWSPDGRTVASGGRESVVRLWDASTGRELRTLPGHGRGVNKVAFAPDSKTVASISDDGNTRIYDVATGDEIWALSANHPLTAAAYAPNGRILAVGRNCGEIAMWDVIKGTWQSKLEGHPSAVMALAYSPDGKTVASSGADRTVRLWQAATGRPLMTYDYLPDGVRSLAFSPDGRTLAAALHDGSVRLWVGSEE